MKKVLIITYHFPPEGGPSVQRISKFVKYMPQFGYIPIVLTTHPNSKIADFSLVHDLPEKININRTADFGRYIPGDIKNKILSKYFIPDKFKLWHLTAIKTGIELIKQNKIDLIFSTSPPHSVHLIAEKIAQLTNVSWVADFRDEWTAHPLFHKQKRQQLHHFLERNVLQHCNHVVTINNAIKKNLSKKIEPKKISIVRNGYDPEDFTQLAYDNQTDNNNKIKITYCGRLNQLHSPDLFFRGLVNLKKSNNKLLEKISVRIIGNIENKKYIKNFTELSETVKFFPYQPHYECIKSLYNSDILLLLATNMDSTEFLPAKLFEYIYLRKPILAIVSFPGELSQLLEEYGNSYIAFENEPGSEKKIINKILIDIKNNEQTFAQNRSFINQFDRKKLTGELSEVFNRILGEM
jgi:hypothetical protein